jgi:hypothetical protein
MKPLWNSWLDLSGGQGMFESLEDQIKNDDLKEESRKERWTRYAIIGAVSVAAVAGAFAAVEFIK